MSARRKLRIAILLDDLTVPAWIGRILEGLADSPSAEVVAVLRNRASRPRRGWLRRAWEERRSLLYRLYSRLDRLLFSIDPDPFKRIDARPLLAGAEIVEVSPRQTAYSDFFPEAALTRMRELDLDLALRFGFRILRGEVLTVPRYGIWSYHHDDNTRIRGGPPGFWEVFEGHEVTGSVLQILTERLDGGEVLCRSWSATHRASVHRNRARVYWKSAAFVDRQLRHLQSEGEVETEKAGFRPYSAPLYRKPTNLVLAPKLLRLTLRAASSKLVELVTQERWHLAWRLEPGDADPPPELFRFREVPSPKGRFWADPFPERNGNGYLLFFEEYVDAAKKGRISCLELDEKACVKGAPFPALERPYHLSYPFTFRYKGALFMMPESRSSRRVEIYRCEGAPDSWALEETLFHDLQAVDATVHEEDDRWWLFVNMAEDDTTHMNDELFLFSAPSPFGPWEPHPCNPVVSDVRRARPAGRLFRWRDQLYRPSQDCSTSYGARLNFNRVVELSRSRYREELQSRVTPHWDQRLTGIHTYNRLDRLTVIDVRRRHGPPSRGTPRHRRPGLENVSSP